MSSKQRIKRTACPNLRIAAGLFFLTFVLLLILSVPAAIAQDLTATNWPGLIQQCYNAENSIYVPGGWPGQWRAFSFYGTEPVWVSSDMLEACTNSSVTNLEVGGVAATPIVVTEFVLTGEVWIQSPGATGIIVDVAAPSGYVANANPCRGVFWEWSQATNCPDCWGLTASEIPPPTVTFNPLFIADIANYSVYASNMEAATQSQNGEATSAGPTFSAMASDSAVMMDGSTSDPCTTTNFSILSVTMSTQGCALVWSSCQDVYVVQSESSLTPTSSWADAAWMFGAIQTTSTTWTDTNAIGQVQEFYRVVQANPDTLNNGIPYGWAVSYGLDPLDPNLAWEDLAGDCLNNLQAYLQGTDPLSPSPILINGTVYAGSTSNVASVIPNLAPMYSFDYPSPLGMIQSTIDSNFYGSASTNLSADLQPTIIYKMTPQGAMITLYPFTNVTNGYYPSVPMLGTNGNLYGVCYLGGNTTSSYCNGTVVGYGTVFQLTTQGALTNLHVFAGPPEGSCPIGGLIQGTDGNFYGVTEDGGSNNCSGSPMEQILSFDGECCDPTYGGYGTVFKLTPQGTLTTLHTFGGGSGGAWPETALLQGSDGYLYGTTSAGNGNAGTVFKISTNGSTFVTLHPFSGGSDGATPLGAVIQDGGGYLYGTTFGGGTNGNGTVFKVDTNGITLTALHAFAGVPDGSYPGAGLAQGSDGNFYGTTVYGGPSAGGNGTVFRITPQGTFSTVYQFTGGATGANPDYGALVQSSIDGYLYGTTLYGGTSGWGTVFKCAPPTYTWSLTSGTLTTGQGSPYLAFATPSPCPVTLSVAATNRFLGCSNSGSITLTPAAPLPGANSPITQGQTLTLSVPTVTGATYLWTGPNTFTSTNQNPTIPYAQSWNAGEYCVAVSADGCTSLASCVSVTVNLLPSSTALSIPDAWAAYISSNSVQITANVISSIATVNVQGAEYFLNAITGTNGAGSAMSASNSVFGSTNVTAVATFTPTFAYGTRQVIYLHAKGSDGLWTLFDPVILNPNANDVLNKVQANYSQMGDVSYSVSVSYFINGVSQQSPVTFTMQQKGGYMSRQTESADGLVTIVNATSTAYVNSNGVYQDGFEVDTLTNMLLGVTSTNGASYYWDVPGFTNAFPSVTGSTITNSANGSATFNSTPADTSAVSVVNFTVDMGRGVPVQETYQGADGTVQQIQHGAPVLVGPSVWLPSSEQVTVTYPNGLVIQWQTAITNAVINQGLSDSLFAIPPPP